MQSLTKWYSVAVFASFFHLGCSEADAQPTSDPSKLSDIVKETDPYRQVKELATFTDKLQPKDIPDAVREVELSQGPGKVLVLSLLASKWADSDTNAAISEARKPGDRITTGTIISSVYSSLARHDLANAIAEVGNRVQLSESQRHTRASEEMAEVKASGRLGQCSA